MPARELERRQFQRRQYGFALQESQGNIQGAARILRIGRNQLAQRMREYGLREEFRPVAGATSGPAQPSARPAPAGH